MGEHMKRCPFLKFRVEEEGSSITPPAGSCQQNPSGSISAYNIAPNESMLTGQEHYASASSMSPIEEANMGTKPESICGTEHNSSESDDDDAVEDIYNYQNYHDNYSTNTFAFTPPLHSEGPSYLCNTPTNLLDTHAKFWPFAEVN